MTDQKLKANLDTVNADDVVVVADQENQKKTAPQEEKKILAPAAESTGKNCLLIGGIVGGVIMTIGIGVLTSMVVKGKNENDSLFDRNVALSAQVDALQQESGIAIVPPVVVVEPVKVVDPVDEKAVKPVTPPVKPAVLTGPEQLTKQISELQTSQQRIVSQVAELIREDLAKQISEVALQPTYLAWQDTLPTFEFKDPEYECFDCGYAKMDLPDKTTYFGQVKNGTPNGRGAKFNNTNGVWQISEGYYVEDKFLGQRRKINSKSKSGVAEVTEWDKSGEHSVVTKYACDKAAKTCSRKVQVQRGIPEGDDSEVDATEIEGADDQWE